jgi:site-specific recombinase XerD
MAEQPRADRPPTRRAAAREGGLTWPDPGGGTSAPGGVPDDLLLRGWLLDLRAGGPRGRVRSAQTVRAYTFALRHLVAWLAAVGRPGLLGLTRELALEWAAALRRERAAATAGLYVVAARGFYDWLVEQGELPEERHPFTRVRVPAPLPDRRLTPPLTPDEVARVWRAAERAGTRSWLALRDRALIAVLCDTGLRVAECVALTRDAIDWQAGTVTVVGKGGRMRVVPLGVAAQQALDRYLRARERVFPGRWALWLARSGTPLTTEGVRLVHQRLGARAGVANLHPHRWRHTYAQTLLSAGVDRETVRLLLGHRSLETLRIYTAATDAQRAVQTARRHSPFDALRPRAGGR